MARLLIVARGRRQDDVVWTPQPLFHLEAMSTAVVQTLLLAGSASLAAGFDGPAWFWREIRRTGATVVTMLYGAQALEEILDSAEEPGAHRLRQVVAPATSAVAEGWRRRFGVDRVGINRGYGSTEASMVTITPDGESPPPDASGHRTPIFEVRIVDPEDRELPPGEIGEIVWRPLFPGVMFDGYWNRPEATVAASRNWWFHGGDLGRLDGAGWLYYAGRRSDLLEAGGRRLTLFDAEKELLRHPAVLEVAVHEIAGLEGELKATLTLRSRPAAEPAELYAWASARLPAELVPRHIEVRSSLPKNATGRVLKRRLREESLPPGTWSAD